MTHYVNLRYGNCWLRPELRTDCDRILELWNKPYVVGNLFMSETKPETFLRFYDKYANDPTEINWVISTDRGEFVGTMGISKVTATDCMIGRFAMEKGSAIPVALPQTLIKSFVFDVLKLQRINFTINTENQRIRKFHAILGATNSGHDETKPASNGGFVTLEHWYYDRNSWEFATDIALCGL